VRAILAVLLLSLSLAACAPKTETHPDFSGWWRWDSPDDGTPPSPFINGPYIGVTAARVALVKDAFAKQKLPDLADLGIDQVKAACQVPVFAGFNGGFGDMVEYLFTPGRLTITNESGMIRRVAMDGSKLPAKVEESHMGTSVGHWEGDTLVVETGGVSEKGDFGKGAQFVERFTLVKPDQMQIRIQIVAPTVLKEPHDWTLTYFRSPGHVFQESTSCVDHDPSFNAKGRQELDLTPPPDIPPPPKD